MADQNVNIQYAQELARAHNLRRAQHAYQQKQQKQKQLQQSQYTQKLAKTVSLSHQSMNTNVSKTDAKIKQQLNTQRKQWRIRMLTERKKKKKLKVISKKYQKVITKYNHVSWTLLYVAAVSDDFSDLIPILDLMSVPLSLYMTYALWNVGAKQERNKLRIKRGIIMLIDLIPLISAIPFSVMIIYNIKEKEQNRVKRARKVLNKIEKRI